MGPGYQHRFDVGKYVESLQVTSNSVCENLPGNMSRRNTVARITLSIIGIVLDAAHLRVYKLDVAKCTGIPPLQAWIEDKTTGKVVAGTKP